MKPLLRLRLYQLASQALPIGGYSHSHGLEAAIDAQVVGDEASLRRWIADLLEFSVGSYEVPILVDLCAAWAGPDAGLIQALNEEFLATRETAELRAATVQMGYSMRTLLAQLPDFPPRGLRMLDDIAQPTLPCAWAAATVAWSIPYAESLLAYLWSWAENQVLVAVKAVPLGQSAGQRVLQDVSAMIAGLVTDANWQQPRSNFAPALAILAAQHETQYSRLFRS
jgi:urease accessory protein